MFDTCSIGCSTSLYQVYSILGDTSLCKICVQLLYSGNWISIPLLFFGMRRGSCVYFLNMVYMCLQIKPLIKPTKIILNITHVQYAWHEFFPGGIYSKFHSFFFRFSIVELMLMNLSYLCSYEQLWGCACLVDTSYHSMSCHCFHLYMFHGYFPCKYCIPNLYRFTLWTLKYGMLFSRLCVVVL